MTDVRERDGAKPKGIDLPFRRSMPLPLLIMFLMVCVSVASTVVYLVARPPGSSISVAERRSPPTSLLTHDVGAYRLAPFLHNQLAPTHAPCPSVRGVVIEGGAPAVARLERALANLCPYETGTDTVAQSIQALSTVRIRFATFARTGEMSSLEVGTRRILINISFATSGSPVDLIGPLLVHEGYHVLHLSDPRNASQEVGARVAELAACRLVLDIRSWPRGCTDAQELLKSGEKAAEDALVKAGYPR